MERRALGKNLKGDSCGLLPHIVATVAWRTFAK